MATRVICGKTVQVNEEGFMTNPAEWDKDIAQELANEEGIGALSPAHWKVIEFCRRDAQASGKAPALRRITTAAGVFDQGIVWFVPQGPGQEGSPHRRPGQARRLCLIDGVARARGSPSRLGGTLMVCEELQNG